MECGGYRSEMQMHQVDGYRPEWESIGGVDQEKTYSNLPQDQFEQAQFHRRVAGGGDRIHSPMKTKKCTCEYCTKWTPWSERVERKLTGRDLNLFYEFLIKASQQSHDLYVASCKLSGTLPGWEWIVEEKKKRGYA